MTSLAQPAPRRLAAFEVASEPGNERLALARVAEAVAASGLAPARLERLKTAVAEATMNAIEHGNRGRPRSRWTSRSPRTATTSSWPSPTSAESTSRPDRWKSRTSS